MLGIFLTEEKRKVIITSIIHYFECERGENIGVIAAEEILDFMLQAFGQDIYNKGITDSIDFLKERFSNLELDMNAILKK